MKGISSSSISHFIGKTGIFCNMGEKALRFTSLSSVWGNNSLGFLWQGNERVVTILEI